MMKKIRIKQKYLHKKDSKISRKLGEKNIYIA